MASTHSPERRMRLEDRASSMRRTFSVELALNEPQHSHDEYLPPYEDRYANELLEGYISRPSLSTSVRPIERPHAALISSRPPSTFISSYAHTSRRYLDLDTNLDANSKQHDRHRSTLIDKWSHLLRFSLPKLHLRHSNRTDSCDEMLDRPSISSYPLLETGSAVLIRVRSASDRQKVNASMLSIRSFTALDNKVKNRRRKRASDIIFDDETLFAQIRQKYAELRGPFRFISAKCLQRIVILGRTPQDFIRPGRQQADLSIDATLLQLFRYPIGGRGNFVFTQWARRVANVPTILIAEMEHDLDDHSAVEGLEFIVAWSARRMAFIVVLLIALCIAIPLIVASRRSNNPDAPVLAAICAPVASLFGFATWLVLSWASV